MARLDLYAYGRAEDWTERDGEGFMDYFDRTDKQLQDLIDKGIKSATLKGYVWSYGVGDGSAHYIVTKLRPFTLAWIPVGDCWSVPDAHIRGLTKEDIQNCKDFESKWAGLGAS